MAARIGYEFPEHRGPSQLAVRCAAHGELECGFDALEAHATIAPNTHAIFTPSFIQALRSQIELLISLHQREAERYETEMMQAQARQMSMYRSPVEALKNNADIKDNRSRFY